MTSSVWYRIGLPTSVGVTILLGWQLFSYLGMINPIMVPSPAKIAVGFSELVTRRYFWQATWITLWETLAGFGIGVSLGLILGALTGTFRTFHTAFYPFVIAFQNTPRVALAPIFLTWFGFGVTSKIVMAAVICFFPVVINTVAGMASVGDNAKMLFQSLGASRSQTFFRLTLPGASAVAFAGVKTALTLALLGAIVGEFVGGSVGLGVLIKELNFQLEVAKSFSVVLFLAVIGLLLYGLIELLERYIITWKHD